jgi:hypothetical protein
MAAIITGFLGRIKSDKGLLIRVIVGTILTITTLGLGFGLLVRTAVYSHHHKKFALEAIGFSDPNFTEQFPQVCSADSFNLLFSSQYVQAGTTAQSQENSNRASLLVYTAHSMTFNLQTHIKAETQLTRKRLKHQ